MTQPETIPAAAVLRAGEKIQLTDPKGRMHTVTLRENGELHTHHGVLKHENIVGQPDGSVVTNSGGHEYLALRPLLRDFVMSMPRGYPRCAGLCARRAVAREGARPGRSHQQRAAGIARHHEQQGEPPRVGEQHRHRHPGHGSRR